MKQKRQLIEDLRTKLKEEKERSCRLEEKVVSTVAEKGHSKPDAPDLFPK